MEHIERVQRELKYKGTILSMYADTIKVPNGNTAVWDFIGHQGAAAVVPVTDDGYPCMRIRLKCQTAIRRSGIL